MQYKGYSGPKEISYLFVDGAYLRELVESFGQQCFDDPQISLDYGQLATGFTKVFYYDCLAPKKTQESDSEYAARIATQEKHFKTIRSLRGWHVIEGVVKRTGKRAQQKEIDILIAVDMLTHTYRRNMHRATFIAGDQDFRPLVEAIVRDGMFIELWYGSASVSSELMLAADAHFKMSPYFIHGKLDRKYRDKYSLPQHFASPDKSTEDGILIECGTDADNNSIELYQSNEQFILIRPDDYNDGYFLHMCHPDLDFLKKIHQLTYTRCEWTRVI